MLLPSLDITIELVASSLSDSDRESSPTEPVGHNIGSTNQNANNHSNIIRRLHKRAPRNNVVFHAAILLGGHSGRDSSRIKTESRIAHSLRAEREKRMPHRASAHPELSKPIATDPAIRSHGRDRRGFIPFRSESRVARVFLQPHIS